MESEQPRKMCEDYWDLLSAFVDGECDAEDSRLVELHVAQCPACARDLAFLRESARYLSSLPLAEPDSTLREAILRATTRRPSWSQRMRQAIVAGLAPPRLALAGAAATAIMVLALGWRALPPAARLHVGPNSVSSPLADTTRQPSTGANVPASPGASRPLPVAARQPAQAATSRHRSALLLASNTSYAPRTAAITARNQVPTKSGPAVPATVPQQPAPDTRAEDIPVASTLPAASVPASAPMESREPPATGTILVADAPRSVSGAETATRLVTASATLSPGTLSSLADLRRDLQRDQEMGRARFEDGHTSHRPELTVSLYKTRF